MGLAFVRWIMNWDIKSDTLTHNELSPQRVTYVEYTAKALTVNGMDLDVENAT